MFLVALGLLVFVGLAGVVLLLARSRKVEVVSLVPPQARQAPTPLSPEELARSGRMIEAIKRYRELHGGSLRDAKEAVEAFARGSVAVLPSKSSVLREVNDRDIEAQIRSGHLIDAIKLYREKTGVGLKEAKDAVEAWRDRMRAS